MNRVLKLRTTPFIAAILLAAFATIAVACGGSDAEFTDSESSSDQSTALGSRGPAGAPGAAGSGGFAATTVPATVPAPFPTIVPPAPPSQPRPGEGSLSDSDLLAPPLSPLDEQVAQVGQQRIIVRNVDMTIEAPDVAAVIAEIGNITTQIGGWIVRTQNVEVHRGAIDIRVPADRLDETLITIRGIASNVTSEISTSQDFTEEFTDATARIQTLQDTVDALRALFDRAEKIEDALTIQREITRIQSEIESMQARVNFLSQSAAFSLVRIVVQALPQEMEIIAGDDVLAAAGRPVRFRAQFTPPQGIEEFRIEWDFGDGTPKHIVTGVAPVNVEGRVISAPVVHIYPDDTDSPYIVNVEVNGTGESGAAKGEDVMVVTVNRVPPIEVFTGDNRTVEEGEEIKLSGSFTRPDGVENLRYTWDFADGSAPVNVDADPGATAAEIDHRFANSRNQNYNVTLTVRGDTPSGSTEGVGTLPVRVTEPESLTAGSFAPGDSGKSAFRVLSAIGSGLGTALIYIGVLSPLWIVIGIGVYLVNRNQRATTAKRKEATRLAQERLGTSSGS